MQSQKSREAKNMKVKIFSQFLKHSAFISRMWASICRQKNEPGNPNIFDSFFRKGGGDTLNGEQQFCSRFLVDSFLPLEIHVISNVFGKRKAYTNNPRTSENEI